MSHEKETTTKTRKNRVICISGLAGSGKSTLAKRLASKYGYKYFSGGDALKALALRAGFKSLERGWWESEEGMGFLKKRGNNREFDKMVDQELLEEARKGNVVLDSWTMPWLLKDGFKIWLKASPRKRAQRIAKRDRITLQVASEALKQKERKTKEIYKSLYGFDLGEDFDPFNFILDTENLNISEVFEILCTVIDNVFLRL